MKMEVLYKNYVNTTTIISVDSGTGSVANMLDRKDSTKYQSDGYNNDLTTTSIRFEFGTTETVSRIALQDINFKSFKIYYNSNSANLFTPVDANTSTSVWSQNSETSLYLHFATTTAVVSITIEATATMDADQEKEIHDITLTRQLMQLDYNPDAKSYKPKIKRKEYSHEMSDGGTSVYKMDKFYNADLKLKFVSASQTAELWSLYDLKYPFVFTPFPTGTSWDNRVYEVNWIKDFEFDQPASNNYADVGYNGTMRLRETPK